MVGMLDGVPAMAGDERKVQAVIPQEISHLIKSNFFIRTFPREEMGEKEQCGFAQKVLVAFPIVFVVG